jgi:hypothetical protein
MTDVAIRVHASKTSKDTRSMGSSGLPVILQAGSHADWLLRTSNTSRSQ